MPKIPTRSTTGPRQRPPFLIGGNLTLALIRQDGEEGEIITAITLLRRQMTIRLERIEKKIDALAAGGGQETLDRLVARAKTARVTQQEKVEALTSDTSAQKE